MRITLALLTFILLVSCNRNTVRLDKTNAKGEVPLLGNLTFRFSASLAGDSMLNQWDSTQYISFKPAIAGRFRWEQPDMLVFSPSKPLPPATNFTAEIKTEILRGSKFGRIGNADRISFFTPELRLDDVNAAWVLQDEQSHLAVPQLDIYFNYPVSPAALKDKLSLTVDGKPVNYNLQTLSDDNRITIRLQNVPVQDKDLDAAIVVAKGLVPKGGTNPAKQDIKTSYRIPSPFNLVINDISAEHDGLNGTVSVKTSQQVVMQDIASMIRIEPAVKYSIDATDDGFVIRSDRFNADKTYQLTIEKGLKGKVGGVLQEEYDNNIAFGELEPSLKFATGKSVYLSGKGNRMIEMRIVNVPKIKVIISKIYESNLLTAQRYGYYPKESRSETDNENYYDDYNGDDLTMGDVIYEKEIDTRSLPQAGNSRLFQFNVEDRLPDFKGIYHIKVRSAKDYWVSDSRFISVSDMGLIAKEGQDKLFVFANSIKTADPLEGVNIIAYGGNNQVLGMGATNKDGVAEIAYTRKEFAGFRPAMVIAKTENDFNYLPFSNTRVNTSRFETGGKQGNSTGLDAFIYAERDIYRPGEKVNFSVIVRNREWHSPGEIPLKLKFLLPNGKELKTFRKTLNEEGSLEGNVDISSAAITGSYTLEVYTSNDVLLGNKNFSIEEFVPDRIKVTAKLDQSSLQPGGSAKLSINAVNFFGPPAANRNYETEIQVRSKYFNPKKYSRYNFGIQNQGLSLDKVLRQGKTDDQGNAVETYEVPEMFRNSGLLQANFYTTVFDETGRPVSRMVPADIFTQPVFFGVAEDGYSYYPLNQPVKFAVIALDKNEQVLNGAKAVIKMIKHEYRTVLSKSGSYFRYESQEIDKLLSEQTVTISGENTSYSFVPRSPGDYELRISIPGGTGYVGRKFYSYGAWGSDDNSFEVNTEGNVDIETDRKTYQSGETAKILFKAPFDGKMLVTTENDKVVSYQYVNVEKRTASIDLKITNGQLPNVFITATLFKPHTISDIPLTVAHGYQNIKVEEKSRIEKVEIIAAKTSRSKTMQQVTVKAAPGSFVTLAAVDNGVLQVTDFKTPDPYNYFYASRALQVNAYDLYPYLFPELRTRLSSTGGDAESDMQKRVNPMPSKRIQIVSYWSGIAKANGDGQVKFNFNVPQFSGQIRLMAVAYKNNMFGSAEAATTIADPIVLSTALPRFLSPGDTIAVPVTITNTTDKKGEATAVIRSSGPIKILGNAQQQLSIAANSEAKALFNVVAASAVDTGKVVIDVQGFGEKFSEETPIGVRPASPLQVMSGSGAVTGKTTINIPVSDFMQGSVKYKLVLSRSPLLESGKQLQYLIQYPYGCTEQVISSAFPQLYYSDLADQLAVDERSRSNANENVQEAIRKIKLRQLYNGAVTLWDGEGTENWWSTIYAAHFLIEAQKAGFDVDNSLLSGLLNYINGKLRNKQTIVYYYNRDQKKKIAPKEVAYSLYVLALASRANVPAMNYYKANPEFLSLDSKYLLSVSYAISGDKKRFGEILPSAFTGEVSVAQTGGSFYSPIRDEAIALSALADVDPGNAQIPVMARHVAEQLKQRSWYSTQESAFGLLALGKVARTAGRSDVTAAIKVNGKQVAVFDGKDLSLNTKKLTGNNIEIDTKGNGKLFYYWQSEGISVSGQYRQEDNFIKVRRQFFDRNGRRIEGNSFKQNELVIVQLSLEKSYDAAVENIVLTDILPAGFEIENPRTKEIPGMDWVKDASEPMALDVRDDRINLFVDLYRNRQVYYYAVRAVSPGAYMMGPVAADAMYNGEYHSYHGAGRIRVSQ